MPQSYAEHMALAERKLQLLLDVSEQVLSLVRLALERINTALRSSTIPMTWRIRVLIGLALKACASFESLLVDARIKRGECSHHLKTLVESFIYYHWVAKDEGDQRAKLVYAEGCRAMAVYHENNAGSQGASDYAIEWRDVLTKVTGGIEPEWRQFREKTLATRAKHRGR